MLPGENYPVSASIQDYYTEHIRHKDIRKTTQNLDINKGKSKYVILAIKLMTCAPNLVPVLYT